MNTDTAKAVISFMEAYNEHYRELVLFLNKKMSKVMADDLYWLSESLPDEQAYIMKGQSLEQKRLELFKKLGIEGYTAAKLQEEAPEEYKAKLQLECRRFNDFINQVQKLNSDILETVEKKLKYQAELVQKTGIKQQETYNGYGNKVKTTTGGGIIGNI